MGRYFGYCLAALLLCTTTSGQRSLDQQTRPSLPREVIRYAKYEVMELDLSKERKGSERVKIRYYPGNTIDARHYAVTRDVCNITLTVNERDDSADAQFGFAQVNKPRIWKVAGIPGSVSKEQMEDEQDDLVISVDGAHYALSYQQKYVLNKIEEPQIKGKQGKPMSTICTFW
jgi:hypothetical protein